MDSSPIPPQTVLWKLRTRMLELGRQTRIMAIVNLTPDSFSDGGQFLNPEAAIAHALQALEDGADLVDLGAESTRPGSHAGGSEPTVSAQQEQDRLLPVVEGILRERPHTILSVDTYKSATARAACRAGAEILNDVSGFLWDAEMPRACAEAGCGVVLMHTRGLPDQWRTLPPLSPAALLADVQQGLRASLHTATQAGIQRENIVLDPGYGFGKSADENFALLHRQQELLTLGRPLLVGLSRKSFLGRAPAPLHNGADAPAEQREIASVAALTAAILHGASLVRVHSVRPSVEAARIADAIRSA